MPPDPNMAARRLARAEFTLLLQELDRLAAAPPPPAPAGRGGEIGFIPPGLPPLPVPLGHIATAPRPETLPVVGVALPAADSDGCVSALTRLLSGHHASPFARLLFVAETLELLPLLGRYGFAVTRRPEGSLDDVGPYLAARFGMQQLRRLITADLIWSADTANLASR